LARRQAAWALGESKLNWEVESANLIGVAENLLQE